MHYSIPQIEQYANQEEWIEGTLVEELIEEERLEKEMKEFEKTLDLDSIGQVFFTLPRHLGAGTSSATTSG